MKVIGYLPLGIFIFHVFMSQVLLPHVIKKRDLGIFFDWGLYDVKPPSGFYDITWDNGETFLLRDNTRFEELDKINKNAFFSVLEYPTSREKILVRVRSLKTFDRDSQTIIQAFGGEGLEIWRFKGSFFDHVVMKKNQELKEIIPL